MTISYHDIVVAGQTVRTAYRAFGNKDAPRGCLLCAHGITHNSRVFDFLASAMSRDYYVICPDIAGRGESDWLNDKLSYGFANYAVQISQLLEKIGITEVVWLGTSMGGITGMFAAVQKPALIRRMILNDIGPAVSKEIMHQTAEVSKTRPAFFESFEQAFACNYPLMATFGIKTESMAREMIANLVKKRDDGKWIFDFDPDIYSYTKAYPRIHDADFTVWELWEKVTCPVLVLHGQNSIALRPDIIEKMKKTHKQLQVIDIPETGHAPHLMNMEQVNLIRDWLIAP